MLDMVTMHPVGLEFETLAVNNSGKPVDLSEVLATPIVHGDFGCVVPDGAGDQIEFVTNPSTLGKSHLDDLRNLADMARKLNGGDINYLYLPRRPAWLPRASFAGWKKPRLVTLREALSDIREGGRYGDEVVEVGDICAYHIHFGFPDVCTDEAMTVCCALNAAAPAILDWVHAEYNIPHSDRSRVWNRFARSERLPAPRWFPSFQTYQDWFESIPRLISQVSFDGDKHTGEYAVDLQMRQKLRDRVAEGTCWHTVRLRPGFNTVEFRPLPTIANHHAAFFIAQEIDKWIVRVVDLVGTQQFADFNDAMRSGILPDFRGIPLPANEADWWWRWFQY